MQSNKPANHPDSTLSPALTTLWKNVCNDLSNRLGEAEFDRWFSPINLVRLEPDSLWLSAPNPIYSLWIEENYWAELTAAIGAQLPKHPPVRFEIAASGLPFPEDTGKSDFPAPIASSKTKGKARQAASTKPADEVDGSSDESPRPAEEPEEIVGVVSKKLRQLGAEAGLGENNFFDNYIVGPANRIAAAAAKAVAEKPGKTYHPYFVHSASGLGKTHLLHAIGWDSLRRRPRSKVVYITAEKFANQYIEAIQKNNLVAFRKRYRDADMLLIDDVQFLSGKEGMQEEFYHTFNSVTDRHKQIVLASDRPASEIRELEERLVSRFKWGMTAEIVAPVRETRIAILRRKRDERAARVPDWVIDYIAENVTTNVRAMEGALLRAAALTSIHDEEIILTENDLAELLIDYTDHENERQISVQEILEVVSDHYDIPIRELTGKRRTSRLVEARHMGMALAREKTDLSLAEIGKDFGGRDHGTVINACRKIAAKTDTNPAARRTLDFLRRNLLSGPSSRSRSRSNSRDRERDRAQ